MNPPIDLMNAEPEPEEGCCCCLTDAVDVAEWHHMVCGAIGGLRHRVCKICFTQLDRDNQRKVLSAAAHEVEDFEIGMTSPECPICRRIQPPSHEDVRQRCRDLHREVQAHQRMIREGRNHRIPPNAPVAANWGLGGDDDRPNNDIFQNIREIVQPRERVELPPEGVLLDDMDVAVENEPAALGRVFIDQTQARLNGLRDDPLIAERVRAGRNAFYAEGEYERIQLRRQEVERNPDPRVLGGGLIEMDLRVEQARHRVHEAHEVRIAAEEPLNELHEAYILLFVPDPDDVYVEQENLRRVARARRAARMVELEAEANAQILRRDQARARLAEINANNVLILRQQQIDRIDARQDRLDANAWNRQREKCWSQIQGRPCETREKTCRFCSHAGCNRKVCRRCDTCGGH